ncbi:magnesium transporter MRS2-4 isoform X2 [Physcomitrium patens]|uniref:Magnesium transporter n=1 Tax=Physcomitrium patens TaxID=3218 RepID=A0A2K1JPP6_PHYPA|nr:magnesium transporter MRS2-4-like isoform X2 [Physcomitrium patens]PNR43508.1 hypothetical protein PHYPA_015889 [Physcomitrium patens]|eukprot:XP_024390959.1 magnesium transporter MRS2-4-like isoform X2 [Physcomitrella patens]
MIRKVGIRTWMRFDATGNSEIFECDKNDLLKRVTVPARDLRIMGPIFSQSSHILARENAMVVNLEFVKAIITAEEVYILDPSNRDVKPFIEQLSMKLLPQNALLIDSGVLNTYSTEQLCTTEDELPEQLPFEFQVLEIALDVVCNHLEANVHDLERTARPALDMLTRGISTRSLELVRMVKTRLTHLSARVQKVRDELMQLLDDDEDMSDLYLTRKLLQAQHPDSPLLTINSDAMVTMSSTAPRTLARLSSMRSHGHTSRLSSTLHSSGRVYEVEELEMLLEAYFMQVDAGLNKLSLVREYIDDTEDYVNVRLDHQRNQLFQFQITLGATALSVAAAMSIVGVFGMNIHNTDPFHNPDWLAPTLCSSMFTAFSIFVSIVGYVHWKGLFEK